MSLMLRKKCQPVLDRHGLSSYHADVYNRGNSVLAVVGECGQPLVYLTGITYSKSVPDTEEIDYSVELLEEWLSVHIKTVIDYITKAKAFKLLPEVATDTKEYQCKQTEWRNGAFNRIAYVNGHYKVTIDDGGNIVSFKRANKRKLTGAVLNKAGFDIKQNDKALKYLTKCNEYLLKRREVEQLKTDLSACKI